MKTETELKETWCPYAHALGWEKHADRPLANAVANRGYVFSKACLCIGLACSQCVDCGAVVEIGDNIPDVIMSPDQDPDKPKGEGWKNKTAPIGAKTAQRWERKTGERHAYCGRNIGEALRQEVAGAISQLMDAIHGINNFGD